MALTILETAYGLRDRYNAVKHNMELDMANGDPPDKRDVQELLTIADDAIIELMLECD